MAAEEAGKLLLEAASGEPAVQQQLNEAPRDAGRKSSGCLDELGEEDESVRGW